MNRPNFNPPKLNKNYTMAYILGFPVSKQFLIYGVPPLIIFGSIGTFFFFNVSPPGNTSKLDWYSYGAMVTLFPTMFIYSLLFIKTPDGITVKDLLRKKVSHSISGRVFYTEKRRGRIK